MRTSYTTSLIDYYIIKTQDIPEEALKKKIRWKLLVQFSQLKYSTTQI